MNQSERIVSLISETGRKSSMVLPGEYCVSDLKEILVLAENMKSNTASSPLELSTRIFLNDEPLADSTKLSSLDRSCILAYNFSVGVGTEMSSVYLGMLTRQLVQLTSVDVPLARHRHEVSETQRAASMNIMRAWCKLADDRQFSPAVDASISGDRLLCGEIQDCKEYIRLQQSCMQILSLFRMSVTVNIEDAVNKLCEDVRGLCAVVLGDVEVSGILCESNEFSNLVLDNDASADNMTASILNAVTSKTVCERVEIDLGCLRNSLCDAILTKSYSDFASSIQILVSHYRCSFSHPPSGLLPIPNALTDISPELLRFTQCFKRLRQ